MSVISLAAAVALKHLELVQAPSILANVRARSGQLRSTLQLKVRPHPVVTDTDRDKYCVQRIIDFYKRHQVDVSDYFLAAWQYRHVPRTSHHIS